ncbi:MAG: GNAT family N-acetyltransferase [Mesorhizobium sp.]|nr:GNAT family N-acetyltransferase [Mesorhizobium sp.]
MDHLIATIDRGDGTQIVLPLEIVARGPFRVARFMGGSHANGNFPAVAGVPRRAAGSVDLAAISAAVRAQRPDIDLVHLERLTDEQSGAANPLAGLASMQSPNIALSVDLAGGFDALLTRASGKRKRKKHRSQTRKYEAAGGVRRLEATTVDEVDRLLTAFFAMKRERFRKMGVADVFADAQVQLFFRSLFADALRSSPPQFVLHGIEVGGVLRAISGSSRAGGRLICEFGAIAEDDLVNSSPGEFLFFENIREACEQGYAIYDFSVGDEHYKRLWCDIETKHFDLVIPVTLKGRGLAAVIRLASGIKRFVKSNELIWGLVKRLRKQAAAPQPAADDAD